MIRAALEGNLVADSRIRWISSPIVASFSMYDQSPA
jgi:hypothetical protein